MPQLIGVNFQRLAKHLQPFLTVKLHPFCQGALSHMKEFRQSICDTLVDLICSISCSNLLGSILKISQVFRAILNR